MERIQKINIKINKKEETKEKIIDYIIELFNEKVSDEDFLENNQCITIEVEEIYMHRNEIKEIAKKIADKFPQIEFNLKGKEETTYEFVEYTIDYIDNKLEMKMSDFFYERFPEDYDEYVDFCNEFDIDEILDEEDWEEKNADADCWYFIEGLEATTNVKISNTEKI